MWTLAITPVAIAVAVVVARGRDGLFELLNLVGEESSAEGTRHCYLVWGGSLKS
jgi:hypothetical protein